MKPSRRSHLITIPGLLILGILAICFVTPVFARQFNTSGLSLDLADVTTNVDVYFSAMRFNRASNEWDADVIVSNKSSQRISGPIVVLIDSFTGTTGMLRSDGTSSNQFYYDFSAQLAQGVLASGNKSSARTIGMGFTSGGSPRLVTRVFAGASLNIQSLAFTRTLNQAGQPLPGISIEENGPDGVVTNVTDNAFGVVTLGNSPGAYVWKFAADGYLPVWRQAMLQSNFVAMVPYPRLTLRSTNTSTISPLTGGAISNTTVQAQWLGGGFSQNTTATLTLLDGQTLPGVLPAGWSPLQAFWLESGVEFAAPATTTLVPWGAVGTTESVALVKFDSVGIDWQVVQLVNGSGTNAITVSVPTSGAYALVVPDVAPNAPPAAVTSALLQAANALAPDPAKLIAGGTVTPASSPASIIPELVTATADIAVTNTAGPLSSGTFLRGEVSENYLLNDGSTRVPPLFETYLVGYQRPGGSSLTNTLHAKFPLRPLLLFGPQILNLGVVHVDLYSPSVFNGGVITTNGGLIATDAIRLLAPAGAVQRPQAIQLQTLNPTNFTSLAGTNFTIAAAFEMTVGGISSNELALQVGLLPPNGTFVLAKVIEQSGLFGLEPRDRLHTDASGNLINDEPASGDRLPGLNGAGQYLLLTVSLQQALVKGIADNSSSRPSGGLPVTVAGQPWLTFSANDGSFKLLAPRGSGTLHVNDLTTGDTGTQSIVIPPNLSTVNTSVASGVSGLQVSTVSPSNGATNVAPVSPIIVNFTRAINPSTLTSNAVQLLNSSNQPVLATTSLNLANTTVTLLPNFQLDAGSIFTLVVSTNIADGLGRTLSGQNQFTFTTALASVRDPAAQLIIYAPGATNLSSNVIAQLPGFTPGTNKSLVVVQGSAGTADPGVPVVIANENSGETTTVLSKTDGSFAAYVGGQEQDFISATFISLNGSRIYLPVNRQLFDDGSVGLYQQGGVLQSVGNGGAVQMTVPPNAIQGRTKFQLVSLSAPELQDQLSGATPNSGTVAGSALNLHIEGQPPTLPVTVNFPVNLTALNYPTNESPTNIAAMIALATDADDGGKAFEAQSQMTFVPQGASVAAVVARSSPTRHAANDQISVTGSLQAVLNLNPIGFQANLFFDHFLVPLIFGPRLVTIKGIVGFIPSDKFQEIEAGRQTSAALGAASLVGSAGGQLLTPIGNALSTASLIGDFLFNAAELALEKPLEGAFVTVAQSSVPSIGPPGRVQTGMVYATSAADGTFLTVAPMAGDQYLVSASHPLFQKKLTIPVNPVSFDPSQQNDLSLAGVVYKNFFFSQLAPSLTPPNVSIASLPVQPAPGQPCVIQINAFQATAAPKVGVGIDSIGSTNLLTGTAVQNVQYTLTPNPVTTNGTTTTWTGTLTVNAPVRAVLKVVVQGTNSAQSVPKILYPIAFTGSTPVVVNVNIPPPDTNDVHGPLVVSSDPSGNGFVGENSQITIYFNKPIDAFVTNNLNGIVLSGGPSGVAPPTPVVHLSADQQVLFLQFPGLASSQTYTLTLSGQSIRDLAGQPLDQKPSTAAADSFSMVFRTTPNVTTPLPGLVSGGRGAAISGTKLYVLDQGPQANYLMIYDISNPAQPKLLSQTHLLGAPRDLVVIPQYGYYANIHSPAVTNDLVTVVGGDLTTMIDENDNVSVPGQYMWVFAVGDGTAPRLIAQPIVTLRVGSAVPKVRWSPPYLVYQEYGADIQLVGFVNLQELIIGYGASRGEQGSFPDDGKPGVDLNNDGDYVDPGETPPLPELQPAEFYGKHQNYVLQHTTQGILDFSVADGGATVGVVMRNGVQLDATNRPIPGATLPPMYRTLVFHGLPLNTSDPTNSAFVFGNSAYPRWVTVINNLQMISGGAPLVRSVALVSLEPDDDGVQKLAVIDISFPNTPQLLNKIALPDSLLGGPIESLNLRADGFLELAGAQNLIVLNPSALALTNVPAGQLHPAIVDVIPSAGTSMKTFGTTTFGVHAVAENGRLVVVQSPPQMQFVNFPSLELDPSTLFVRSPSDLQQIFSGMQRAGAIPPAHIGTNLNLTSDLVPFNPALHFNVLVTAPGGSGTSIELGLESINLTGKPLSNLGHGFAPVRAESDSTQTAIGQGPRPNCGADIRSLTAYRVSNDSNSIYFNYYISRPFALITEAVSAEQVSALKTNGGVDREILFSSSALRTFIDPKESNNVAIGPFAAQIDSNRQLVYPISGTSTFTVNRSYVTGPNPPPSGGATEMPGTYGTICAQSGEFRTEATDMVLPSPRMPIAIKRQIGSQDAYEGPFGVGWDFNYNQRLTVLDPQSFPVGLQMPIVVRDNGDDSEIAGSQDVLFHTGMGSTVLFKWADTNMPSGYAQDPLVQQFNYQALVSDYFLPEKRQGVFDLLVKFKDGRFERLTPDGLRYRYAENGRLEMIIDRYPNNHHDLEYDDDGHLVRIDDRSVTTPRYVQFGYFRRMSSDANFTAGLDADTSNAYLEGKICRIRDYAGADVLYQYTSDGFLTNRLGKVVAGENGGFAGRSQTFYIYNNCQIVGVAATTNGTPIFAAVNSTSSKGNQVAKSGGGFGNNVNLNIPVENTAASLSGLTTASSLADGSTTQYQFDKLGHITSSMVSGSSGAAAKSVTAYDDNGLVISVKHPEGNSETMVYDTNNVVFRSQGNLLSHTIDPGPRGGTGYAETFNYDAWYNLKSGALQNPDGFIWTYTLTPDHRDVGSIKFGNAGTETFTYNKSGQILTHADVRGVQTTLAYDTASGFSQTRTLGSNLYTMNYGGDYASLLGRPASISLPTGDPLQLQYNANLKQVEVKRAALVEDFGYDEQGHNIFHQQQLGNGQKLVVHSSYDAKGFLTTNIMDGVEVDGIPTTLEYDFTPDVLSRIQSIRYPGGTILTYGYDSRGNVTNTTVGDYSEQSILDLNNNVTSILQGGDVVKTLQYDGLDRPTTITRKTGSQDEIESFTYYTGGERKSRTVADALYGEVAQETDDQIDELGRNTHRIIKGTTFTPIYQDIFTSNSVSEIGPRMTTTRTWNTAGYDTDFVTPILHEISQINGSGNITQVDRQEDGATYSEFFTYDTLDHRITSADNLGSLFGFSPRADGALLLATNAVGHVTTYSNSVLGEITGTFRADGMETDVRHNQERNSSFNGDPSAGFRFTYDNDFRLSASTLRNGASSTYANFDARNLPQTVTIPGGSVSMAYDLQRRVTDKTVIFLSTRYFVHNDFDALDRVRQETYQQDNGTQNKIQYYYDEAGPLLTANFQEDGNNFQVRYGYTNDSSRVSVTYPSGAVITEQRDSTGRLTGVSDISGNIINASSFQGNSQPKNVTLGSNINILNQYDVRGRLLATRASRISDGKLLTDMRYQHDGANNLQLRQFIHRHGKSDQLSYDSGERLGEAKIGAIPLNSGTTSPLYDRTYHYHANGLDYLIDSSSSNLTADIPAFATNWTAHDNFLLPGFVDGFGRGNGDLMGRVTNALLQMRSSGPRSPLPTSAVLTHDGLGNLTSVVRADGITENNFYQPSGLRYRRTLSQSGSIIDDRRYVYDNLNRLLEEYQQNGTTNSLIGRYYYANSDAPDACDLLSQTTGTVTRYYYLKDAMGTIIAVADDAGNVVERTWYDPFGQPVIEGRDESAPTLSTIISTNGGVLLIGLSESVWPTTADPGLGTNIVTFSTQLSNDVISVSVNSTNIAGTAELLPLVAGYPPYSVLQFTPGGNLPDTDPGVSGWWPADSAVLDVAGGHNGALRGGATNGPGLINQAFVLNGASAYVEIPDDPALNVGSGDFTFALWANISNTNGSQVLAEKWIQSSRSGWSFIKMPDNSLRLSLGDGAGNEVDISSGPLANLQTNWVHYTIRRLGNQCTIYTNGVQVASGNNAFALNAATSLKFGSREGTSFFVNGKIDEVIFFSRALNAGEITAVAGGVSLPGTVTLTLNAGKLVDEWGNSNVLSSISFQPNDTPGTIYYQAEPQPQTAAPRLARSGIGSPFLFHGQYFDYETGLVYLRARFYDPYSGMFFEPDPLGYEGSVNLYAGMGNNPIGFRDPSGLKPEAEAELEKLGGLLERSENSAEHIRVGEPRLEADLNASVVENAAAAGNHVAVALPNPPPAPPIFGVGTGQTDYTRVKQFTEDKVNAIKDVLRNHESPYAHAILQRIENGEVKIAFADLGKAETHGHYNASHGNTVTINGNWAQLADVSDLNLAGTAAHEITHWAQAQLPGYFEHNSGGRLATGASNIKQLELEAHVVQARIDPTASKFTENGVKLNNPQIALRLNVDPAWAYWKKSGNADAGKLMIPWRDLILP